MTYQTIDKEWAIGNEWMIELNGERLSQHAMIIPLSIDYFEWSNRIERE
jgi:hypothetical protein